MGSKRYPPRLGYRGQGFKMADAKKFMFLVYEMDSEKTVAHIEAEDEVHAINIACKQYGYKWEDLGAEAQG